VSHRGIVHGPLHEGVEVLSFPQVPLIENNIEAVMHQVFARSTTRSTNSGVELQYERNALGVGSAGAGGVMSLLRCRVRAGRCSSLKRSHRRSRDPAVGSPVPELSALPKCPTSANQ
jgi:hypothetical protein